MPTNRILDRIAAWREDLINLNRNNRLLYFRKTKSSTLELRHPSASDLLAWIANGKSVKFWEPTEGSVETSDTDAQATDDLSPTVRTDVEEDADSAEPIVDTGKEDHASINEIVCDAKTRELLLKSLRWLERRAAQEFMDKGLWILYLGIGILEWIDSPWETGESETVLSPILLIPVQLQRDSAQSPYQISRADEDAAINPALAFKLQHDFGITLPNFEDEDEENVDAFLDSVRAAVASQGDWLIRDRIVLSVFSFHKEAMFRDLQNHEGIVVEHPIIRSLILGHRSTNSIAFDPTPEDTLDDIHPPESTFSILDCDASQRQCLSAAAGGHSFVMDGPPGTGKSQTIANMIADALGHGRTVLFVSEKAAALEVVQTRLEHAGLSEFVLELHSHKATRKHVAQTLGRALTTRLVPKGRFPEIELQRLIASRRELTEYARAMNEPREPLGRSVHAVLGDLGRLQHLPQAPTTEAIGTGLSAGQFASICDVADALGRAWGPVDRGDDFLWRSLEDETLTQGRRALLISTLERANLVVRDLAELTRALAEETNLPWTTDVRDSQRFQDLLTPLATRRTIPVAWLCVQSMQPVRTRQEELAVAAEELNGMVERLTADVGPEWRKLNGNDLPALETIRSSMEESPLEFLGSGDDWGT